jgi:hypothetical protein
MLKYSNACSLFHDPVSSSSIRPCKGHTHSIKAAPSIPITAPNVSRRGTRVGTAPPVDPPVAEAPGALGAMGADVAVPGVEVELEGTPVLLMVPLVTPVESGTAERVELGLVLEGATDELEDGWSTYDTTMFMGEHCAPMFSL